jgi:RND family efflux transporter MFP subunit
MFAAIALASACSSPEVEEPSSPVANALPERSEAAAINDGVVAVLAARKSVVVGAPFPGRVERLLVRTGDLVEQGAVLAELDDGKLRDELAMVDAAYQSALAARSKASIELAEAKRQTALARRLYREGVRARESVNETGFAARTAQASLRQAAAIADQKKAEVAKLQANLDDATVRAPFAGVVAVTYAEQGSVVPAGGRVVRVIEPDDLLIRFAVPLSDREQFSKGTAVEFSSEHGETLNGEVASVVPELDPSLQLALVEAEIPGTSKSSKLTAGIVGRVRLRSSAL